MSSLDTQLNTFNLSSFNEFQYLSHYFSIYQDSQILKYQICFRPMMTRSFLGFMVQFSKAYKSYLLRLLSFMQRYTRTQRNSYRDTRFTRVVVTSCASQGFVPSYFQIYKHGLKNYASNSNNQVTMLLVMYQDPCKEKSLHEKI